MRVVGTILPLSVAGLMLVGLTGCWSMNRVDSLVDRALRVEAGRSLPDGSNTLTDAGADSVNAPAPPPAIDLALTNALALATLHSRALQSKREALYLGGLSTLGVLRQFGPQYSGTLDYVMNWPDAADRQSSGKLGLKATQILPLGGELTVGGGVDGKQEGAGTNAAAFTTTAGIEMRQPLLAGAGYEAAHSALIQSRRDLIYGIRSFSLERQDFAIGIMRLYYGLLLKKDVVANTRLNVEQSKFLRRRSEALFKIRRAPAIDVMRSQQQELAADNNLSQTESDYEIGLSRFLIEVGLPVSLHLNVVGEMPAKRGLSLSKETCLQIGLERRLDLKTEEDRLADARRTLRLARNTLLPKVEAYGKAGASAESEGSPEAPESGVDYSAGVSVELPFDRRDERDAVKKTVIALAAAERNVIEKRDSIRVGITESFSRLEALSATVDIERRNIDIAQRRADYAAFRFRNGELSNRDVVEAQNELLAARNAHASALVQYELQRVQLLRDVGMLDVGPDGAMIELP